MQTNHIHKPTMPSSSNVLAQGTSSIMLNGYDSTPRVKNDITPVVQTPGHHKDKLEQIRDSLKPFAQSTSIEVSPATNGSITQNSTQFPAGGTDSGFGSGMLNGVIEEDYGKLSMIKALTDLGFDQQSAYYALKLVNFKSIHDAYKILSTIKESLNNPTKQAPQPPPNGHVPLTTTYSINGYNQNGHAGQLYPDSGKMTNSVYNQVPTSMGTTFYPMVKPTNSVPSAPSRTTTWIPSPQIGQSLSKYGPPTLPGYTPMNGQNNLTYTKSAPLVQNSTYSHMGNMLPSTTFQVGLGSGPGHATDDSCNSSRSESPTGKIQLPETPAYPGYNGGLGLQQNFRTPSPQQIRQQLQQQRQKASVTPVLQNDYQRSHAHITLKEPTDGGVSIPSTSRVPMGNAALPPRMPPTSTVITIEKNGNDRLKPPLQMVRRVENIPTIRTRLNAPPKLDTLLQINVESTPNSRDGTRINQYQLNVKNIETGSELGTVHGNSAGMTGVQSIIINNDYSSSGLVNYENQLVRKTARTKLGMIGQRDSLVSTGSDSLPGTAGVSPMSSGFASPSQQLVTARNSPTSSIGDREPDMPVRCVSPLPESVGKRLKSRSYEKFVKPCKAGMFRFFMEQHIERILIQYQERNQRALQLIKEMEEAGLADSMKEQMLKLLRQKESKYIRLRRQKMNKDMFYMIRHIGVGAFGKVTLVRKKDTDQIYAMKTLSKEDVIQKQQAAHVKAERDILAEANSPWIVKLYFSFQDTQNLYFIMEYVPGGDMMQLLINKGIFSERLARFYVAELTCAIDYVHSLGFIHRDIKPDNILIDKHGHIKLTDFGLCTGLRWTHDKRHYVIYDDDDPNAGPSHLREDSFTLPPHLAKNNDLKLLDVRHKKKRNQAHSVVGTGNYMAPEVILKIGHTQLCDWWSVGVILYEMVYGRPPFMSHTEDPRETQFKIVHWKECLDINLPMRNRLSDNCVNMIMKLICDKDRRIGQRGAAEIKSHPWFKGIDFNKLRDTRAEYIPRVEHAEDTSNFDTFEVKPEEIFGNLPPQKAYNPAFFDFTFRHFFDYEGGQPNPVGRTQQRPSIAPLIELSENQKKNEENSKNSNHQKAPNGNIPNNEKKDPDSGKDVKSPKQGFLSRVTKQFDRNKNVVKSGNNGGVASQQKNAQKFGMFSRNMNGNVRRNLLRPEESHIQEEDEDRVIQEEE